MIGQDFTVLNSSKGIWKKYEPVLEKSSKEQQAKKELQEQDLSSGFKIETNDLQYSYRGSDKNLSYPDMIIQSLMKL